MSRAGNYFSNKIGLNNFWFSKLNINYTKSLSFYYDHLIFLDKYFKKLNIYLLNFSFKLYNNNFFYLYLNIYINYFKKIETNILKKKNILFFFIKSFIFFRFSSFFFNFEKFDFNILFKKLMYVYIFLNNIIFFNKLNKTNLLNKINLLTFNKIKFNLLINYINFIFLKKNNFFFKLKFRSLNNRFLKILKFNKSFKKYNYLYNFKKIISLVYYSFLFKNNSLISNFILYLFSSWRKNHFIIFRTISEIFSIFFNSNILNLKGFYLQVKGKINGQKRKIKLTHSLGKLNFSKFKSKMSYNFFSKLTIFGSIGIKVWFIYDG